MDKHEEREMKPAKFKEQNMVYAEDQPEYLPLPVFKTQEGEVVSCWRLSFWERLIVLFAGRVWLSNLTFNHPLQPQFITVKKSDIFTKEAK